MLTTRKQTFKALQQLLHRHQHARLLGFLVSGSGADVCADLVRADAVERYAFFGEDLSVGAGEADDGTSVTMSETEEEKRGWV